MPINRKNFESGNFKKRYNKRDQHPVFLVLKKNPSTAYTIKELTVLTKMKTDSVRSMLGVLRNVGLIEHKAPYFIFKKKKKIKRRPVQKKKTSKKK